MDPLSQSLLTASLTIIGSVFVFVLTSWIDKFLLTPIQEQKRIIAEINVNLIYFADIYSTPGVTSHERMMEASLSIRRLASELVGSTENIGLYTLLSKTGILVSKTDINIASSNLVGLSNSMFREDSVMPNSERVKRIHHALKTGLIIV